MSGDPTAPPTIRGFHILEDGIAWGFARDGEEVRQGELRFEEIEAAGPESILLFGMLAQLGRYQRELEEATQAMVAASHACIEVARAMRTQPQPMQIPTTDEIFERAESLVGKMMERAMTRATSADVTGPGRGG